MTDLTACPRCQLPECACPSDEDRYSALLAAEVIEQRIRRQAREILDREALPPVRAPEVLTLRDRLARPRPPVRYRIEDWQPTGSRVVIAAQFKAGKTTGRDNLARCLVDGDPWLGQYKVTPVDGTVVILDFEMSAEQLDQWLADQGIVNDDRIIPIPLKGNATAFDILDAQRRTEWATELRRLGCGYLVLDCLRPVLDALGLDEHREAGRFLVSFDMLLAEAGIAEANVVHHMGHLGERSRGDSRIRDWPDVEWRLVRQDDDPASPRFMSAYGRDVDVPESQLSYDPQTRHLTLVGGSRKDASVRGALDDVLTLVEEQPRLSGRAIERELADSGHTQKEIRGALKLGVRERSLEVEHGPRNARLYVSASVRPSALAVRQRGVSECVSASIDDALTQSPLQGFSASADEVLQCSVCGEPLDPVLADEGRHPLCEVKA